MHTQQSPRKQVAEQSPRSGAAQAGPHFAPQGEEFSSAPQPAQGLPNVFVVGAIKSGTTALYHYFKLHRQVFVPETIKETNFMAFSLQAPALEGPGDQAAWTGNSVTSLAEYRRLFAAWGGARLAADVSPCYLYHPAAADNIAELCPHAKVVMVLRNPADCAFSMYAMMRRDGREPCRTFLEAFRQSPARIAAGWEWAWDYQRCPLYAGQVAQYLKLFPAAQLFIRRYDEMKRRPAQFYSELDQFLGIETADLAQANRSVNTAPTRRDMLRKRKLGRWLLRTAKVAGLAFPPPLKKSLRQRYLDKPAFVLQAAERQMLIDHFATDILRLGDLLSLDLGEWLLR